MRKIVLSIVSTALIAASVSQAVAAPSRHHVRRETVAGEQVRDAHNALAQSLQPDWHYSGWSAPAGR